MRLIDWIFDHFWIVFIAFFVLVLVINQWAYDGDLRCLVAECRIQK